MATSGRTALADRVVEQVLAMIAQGRFRPDTRLPPEAVLAAEAQVSRLTLREAVRVLRDKGVLRVEHGRGTFVNPPRQWSVLDPTLVAVRASLTQSLPVTAQQLTEARRVIEVGAAELAARRRTADDVDRLRAALAEMVACQHQDDVPGFSRADVAFHDAVVLASDNPFLGGLLQPIRAIVEGVRQHTSTTTRMREVAIEAHARILDAVSAGDAELAGRAMLEHIRETSRVIEVLEAEGRLDHVPTG